MPSRQVNKEIRNRVRHRIVEFISAWNCNDVEAMTQCWLEDGSLLNTLGVFAQGRLDIKHVLAQEHATIFRNSKAEMAINSVQSIGTNCVLVDAEMFVAANGAAKKMNVALVLKRYRDDWFYLDARPHIKSN